MADAPNSRPVAATTTGIARRFNVMTGETGEVQIPTAGGNLNGTSSIAILHHQSGTNAEREQMPRAFGASGSGNYTGVRYDAPEGEPAPPPDTPPIDEPPIDEEPPADEPDEEPPPDDLETDGQEPDQADAAPVDLSARRKAKAKPHKAKPHKRRA